jgi:hypothetical protein
MTDQQLKDLVEEIHNIKVGIKTAEQHLKTQMALLEECRANGLLDRYESEDGSFYVNKSRFRSITKASYVYSKAVKDLQEREKVAGIATKVETTYLRFEMPKVGTEP